MRRPCGCSVTTNSPSPILRRAASRALFHIESWYPALSHRGLQSVQPFIGKNRLTRAWGRTGSTAPRLPASVRRKNAVAMVSLGSRRRAAVAGSVHVSWTPSRDRHVLVSFCLPGTDETSCSATRSTLGGDYMSSKALPNFPFLLEAFFTKRLMQQRQVSGHTISSYRDTFRMFLEFSRQRLKKAPSGLRFEEIDAPLIAAFLQD